jgi:peptidyl-prolyl cis-trans isomerase D
VIGRAFASPLNKLSKPIVGNSGVYVMVVNAITPVPAPADWKDTKSQVTQSFTGRVENGVYNALMKKGNVEDKRYRFF